MPVPRVLHLGDADGPLGAPFYVMERVVGHVCRNALPPGYADTPEQRAAIGDALVDVLAELHTRRSGGRRPGRLRPAGRLHGAPAAALVAAVGRARRRRSCRRSTSCATSSCARAPSSAPRRSSTATTGSTTRSCTRREPGRIVAVLDWEMSTLGDPLADLGALLAYWSEAGDDDVRAAARIVPPVTAAEGFPTRAEVVDALRGADRLRRLRRRLVPGVRVLQARGRLPGHRRARRRRRDARLGVRRGAAAGRAAGRGWASARLTHGEAAVHAQHVAGDEAAAARRAGRAPRRRARRRGRRGRAASGRAGSPGNASGSSPSSAVISEAKKPGASALTRMP